ncbi:MAG: hypothetical protein L0211_16535, partial [Planctomycetaceae bacterium]|nr:hypothetical protein [Planctomycetaceae bacterium]
MEIPTLVSVLDHPHQAADHLQAWKLRDADRGQRTLLELADCGLTLDLLARLCQQLGRHLPHVSDPDAMLEALRRFLFASRSPMALAALFERDPTALPMLLRAFSLGEQWREMLIDDPEAFDRLRLTGGQPLSRSTMLGDVCAEAAAVLEERGLPAVLRRISERETLRIAYGELICREGPEVAATQLTLLREAMVEAALRFAIASVRQKGSEPPRMAVIALGRLGGVEADYSPRIDLLVIHEPGGETEAKRKAANDCAERVAKLLVRLLDQDGSADSIFRVSVAQLPDSDHTLLSHTADDTLLGFDSFGRTWHRQEMLKARPIAGDTALADAVLDRLGPWIFRRYLNRADETGIKALKRRLERRAGQADDDSPDTAVSITSSRGGLLDIEGAVQFFQLLAGGDHTQVRTGGTLPALAALEDAGIFSAEERSLLEENYIWLRRVQHCLQVTRGADVDALPAEGKALDELARFLELADGPALVHACRNRMTRVWKSLRRQLEAAFPEDPPPQVVDLLLDPLPSRDEAAAAFTGYGFNDPLAAASAMHELAREHIPFLSTRRCRHFLSLIAPRLLQSVGATPDPDRTLADLVRVSNSLGSKGVLWELFNFHPASLQLYVRLCAASPYLSGILTTNPGMIDDLVDSLQLDRLPARAELDRALAELSRGVEDPLPVLHDLKNSAHLRIGVRDILGKDSIDDTHAALADVAEFCLEHLIHRAYFQLVAKHGEPTHGPGPLESETCRLVVLGLGKLGGREPNYHSNLETVFLYEAEGVTRPAPRSRQQSTTNNHFFTQLAQRALKEATHLSPKGRLANVDVVLRPAGMPGAMAMTLVDFANEFLAGSAPLAHWQALCQARPVFGELAVREAAVNVIRQLLTARS